LNFGSVPPDGFSVWLMPIWTSLFEHLPPQVNKLSLNLYRTDVHNVRAAKTIKDDHEKIIFSQAVTRRHWDIVRLVERQPSVFPPYFPAASINTLEIDFKYTKQFMAIFNNNIPIVLGQISEVDRPARESVMTLKLKQVDIFDQGLATCIAEAYPNVERLLLTATTAGTYWRGDVFETSLLQLIMEAPNLRVIKLEDKFEKRFTAMHLLAIINNFMIKADSNPDRGYALYLGLATKKGLQFLQGETELRNLVDQCRDIPNLRLY